MRRLRKIQLGGLLLYFLTLVLEVPVIALRVVFVNFMGHVFAPAVSGNVLLLIGVAPTLWSMFALINPVGSGWWLRQQTGGREPSQRERLAYEDAVELLQAHSPEEPLPLPKGWFVLDRNEPDAGVCGNSLMLSRGLMEMSIAKVLSHELNHLASLDGRITLALNRLILQLPKKTTEEQQEQPQQQRSGVLVLAKDPVLLAILALRVFVWIIRKLVRFAKGGLGLWLATPIWGLYWRGREYAADHYAATLGQADELADFLEVHALLYDRPIPYMWLTDTDHDFTELRIDKLRNYRHEPIADTTEPATA